ncbi:MAG: hypothetical protein VW867_04200 [Gammaproteobacteria bacterium]|jgi:hypothetical protein
MDSDTKAVAAQAGLHHQLFLGMQLMVAVEESRETVFQWMFRLFRRQHEAKFLSSFTKLGLHGLPHAVACAKYHVLSNGVGGVAVEYMAESDTKAWVRFRYPRWMYAGPAICGIPVEASRGFLHGWYAQNGVSLGNPRLGFVCVSEDVTGQFGLCGYFKEYDYDLAPQERLRFAPEESVPAYVREDQPEPPNDLWNAERLAKANRNYAVEYIRNGITALAEVVGPARAKELGMRAGRLTGLQHYPLMAEQIDASDGVLEDAGKFLQTMMSGMGDACTNVADSAGGLVLQQTGLRIIQGLDGPSKETLLPVWAEVWRGAVHSHRTFMDLDYSWSPSQPDMLVWRLTNRL